MSHDARAILGTTLFPAFFVSPGVGSAAAMAERAGIRHRLTCTCKAGRRLPAVQRSE